LIRLVAAAGSADWSRRLDAMSEPNLLQTWAYGEAKARSGPWDVERAIILDSDREIGLLQAFVRKIPLFGGGLIWINRGPLLCESVRKDVAKWREILEALHRHYVQERQMLLRIALPFREPIDLSQLLPSHFRVAESGSGYHSARLDLSQPLDVLRRQLEQKWRHGLNKAERANVVVESGSDATLFSPLIADYSAMMARKGFRTSLTPELLDSLQDALPQSQKLWSVVARDAVELAGFVLIARYSKTAEYLAGSSNASGRKWNVGNLLLWRAITEMKEQGYRWFDLGGMDPERTPAGIYHFKSGLRGEAYRLPDEVEAYQGGLTSFAVRQAIRRARASSA
jgi:hypothetical protein